MTDCEGAPQDEGPWQDETVEHIDELSRLMRGNEEDSVPTYVPDHWSTVAPTDNARLERNRSIPELEKYLSEVSTPASRVLVLPDVPRIIGGLKSTEFIVRQPDDSPDAPPDAGQTIDLRHSAIEAQSWGDFVDFFQRAERQADDQYDEALFAAQQVVEDARQRRTSIDVLLIPGTVNMSAGEYFSRLQRLAQDLGIPVVIRTEDHEEGFDDYFEFRRFDPPTAASPEEYWERREREARAPEPTRLVEPPTTEALQEALDKFWDLRGEDDRAFSDEVLRTLAAAAPETLDEILSGNHHYILAEIAQSEGDQPHYMGLYARIIMAKTGHVPTFELLLHEANQDLWPWDPNRTAVPLGIYARQDGNVRSLLTAAFESAAQHRPDTEEGVAMIPLLSALYHSFSPDVAPLIASHLTTRGPDVHPQQTKGIHDAAKEWLPKYVDVLLSSPESPERTRALKTLKDAALNLLDEHVNPRAEFRQLTNIKNTAGDILLRMGVADQQERMRDHMLWLYTHCGSLVTSYHFEEQYIQFRKLYGDIPEISEHLTLRR